MLILQSLLPGKVNFARRDYIFPGKVYFDFYIFVDYGILSLFFKTQWSNFWQMFLTKPGAAVDYPRWESLFPGKLLSSYRHCCNRFAFATNPAYRESTNPAYRESTNPTYQDRLSTTSNISIYHSLCQTFMQVQINVQWLMILKANVKRPWMGVSGRQIGFLMPPFCRSGQALPNHTWPMTPVWDWEVFALLMMVPVRRERQKTNL